MKITDLKYLKSNGKYIDSIKYKDNTIWKRIGEAFSGGIILKYTASDDSTVPYELTHGSSNYTTLITGDGPYNYTIVTDNLEDLPTRISFKNCTNLLTVDYMCDTSQISDMSSMFENCANLTKFGDYSGPRLNTRNVTNMRAMFSGCAALKSIYSYSFSGSTIKITDTSNMFNGCKSLTSLSLNINTSNVVDMSYMFANCTSLTKWVPGLFFSTENATSTTNMFLNCDVLKEVEFDSNTTADTIEDIANLLVPHNGANYDEYIINIRSCKNEAIGKIVSSLGNMYHGWTISSGKENVILECTASSKYYKPIELTHGGSTYTTTVTGESEPYKITIITDDATDVPTKIKFCSLNSEKLYSLDYLCSTSNMTSMEEMFYLCRYLTSLDVSSFNTSNVTSMQSMFSSCSALTELDVSNFNTSKVTGMGSMFEGCESLTELDVSNFNTSNVTTMQQMFYNCESLTELDASNFNTSNVTGMGGMFTRCTSLTTIKGLNNFNTSNVINMQLMFQNCTALTTLDLSNWDTSNVTYMDRMFEGCSGLTTLDLSNFDFSINPTVNADYMFAGCSSLTTLDLSNFHTSGSSFVENMFSGCTNLATLRLDDSFESDIKAIITSANLPTGMINGNYRIIYCKRDSGTNLTLPQGWRFIYVD